MIIIKLLISYLIYCQMLGNLAQMVCLRMSHCDGLTADHIRLTRYGCWNSFHTVSVGTDLAVAITVVVVLIVDVAVTVVLAMVLSVILAVAVTMAMAVTVPFLQTLMWLWMWPWQ